MGAITFSLDNKLVEAIKRKLPAAIFFETGTYKGDTLNEQKGKFSQLITVELSEELWNDARLRFINDDHVTVIHGDSPKILAEFYNQLSQKSVCYWLDAHWCIAESTAGEKSQCPLLKELEAIYKLNKESVILIDDARLFLAPPLAPHEISEWPIIHDVIKNLYALSDEHEIMVINDVIIYYPIALKKEIVDYAQQYGVDWLSTAHYQEENEVLRKICEERLELIQRLDKECKRLAN